MKSASKKEYIFLSVEFNSGKNKSYYYLTDDDSIEPDDFVIVPAGKDNDETLVYVADKEYFDEYHAPFPIEKLKSVIRKSDKNWQHDENIEEQMRSLFGRHVEVYSDSGKVFQGLLFCVVGPSESESGLTEILVEANSGFLKFSTEEVNWICEIKPTTVLGKLNRKEHYCRVLKRYISEGLCRAIANGDEDTFLLPEDTPKCGIEKAQIICKGCCEGMLM